MAETVVMPAFMQPGTDEYLAHKGPWLRSYLVQVEGDCVPFADAAKQLKDTGHYAYYIDGEQDWDRFCREYLETETEFVERIIEGAQILQNRGRGGAIPAQEAVQAARENPAGRPGGTGANQHTAEEQESSPDNIRSANAYGTSATHTLRRLARDRPDLLDRVEAGELSPNAAAIEAGFRRKKVQVEPSPQSVQRMLERYLPGWRLVNTDTGESL